MTVPVGYGQMWDANTGEPIGGTITGHTESVESVAFSPDGKRIVSGGDDGTMRMWDAATGRPIGQPVPGPILVLSVAFSPDGKRIVSGGAENGADNAVQVWDADTGKPVGQPMTGHNDQVFSVAFSPDGERIVSAGGADTTLRLWPARADEAVLCAKLTTNMSHKQWRDWVLSPDINYIKVCPDLPVAPD